jgi:hypothetical protein
MLNLRSSISLTIVLAILLYSGGTKASDRDAVNSRIAEAIAKVRTGTTVNDRAAAAEPLCELTRGRNNARKVDSATITEIISLLDIPEDSVHNWVACALGNIGPPAKAAIPKLQKLLPEVDCLAVDKSSADTIIWALKKMGAKLPTLACLAPRK